MINDLKENIIQICRLIYAKGFVSATDGNVSIRISESGNILTTATGISKGFLKSEDIIEIDLNGNIISGNKKPSTEIAMHLFIYNQRKDINAVVHAHPPYATGFATARQDLTGCLFPEVIIGLGAIPLADYATPSTIEVVKSIEPFIHKTEAILLSNHGVVAYGKDLLDAYFKLEKVEHAAHITFIARLLGGEKCLTSADVEKLKSISRTIYEKNFSEKLACTTSDKNNTNINNNNSEDDIRQFIKNILGQSSGKQQ